MILAQDSRLAASLRYIFVALIFCSLICPLSAFSQQTGGSYTVETSGGSSRSPFEPPPGTELWNQQQQLARLGGLMQEIETYREAKAWSALQEHLASNVWMNGFQNLMDVFGGVAARIDPERMTLGPNGTFAAVSNAKLPDGENLPNDVPEWENSRPATSSIEIMQHEIAYDAKKLGMPIVAGNGTETEVLNQLVSQINSEASKISQTLIDAGVQPNGGPALPIASARASVPGNYVQPGTGMTFDPSTLSPAGKAAWELNQKLMAAETLGNLERSRPGANGVGQPSADSILTFDPSKLSPAERAAWEVNQEIIARETLGSNAGVSLGTTVVVDSGRHSVDGGKTWASNKGTPFENYTPASGVVTINGMYHTEDGGTTWQLNQGTALEGYKPPPASVIVNGMYQSQDGGKTWLLRNNSGDILDAISGTDSFGYPTSTRQSPDGRLTVVTQLSFRNGGGIFPQSIVKWAVYDQGRFVAAYDSDVNLLADGKYQVLTTPGAMGVMTPDGKPRAPVYTTYDAGLEIQKQQFYQANNASLQSSGYGEIQAFGGGVFAGFKVGHGWDLLDSHGENIGDGVFQHVKPLIGGAFAASTDSFGAQWEVFDASGHRLGDGTYADVEVQNGQIAAWKQLGGGSPTYLAPSPTNSVSSPLPIQQTPASMPASTVANSTGPCLIQPGMSAIMNHGVATAPIWGPCFSSQSQSSPQSPQATAQLKQAVQNTQAQAPAHGKDGDATESQTGSTSTTIPSAAATPIPPSGQCLLQAGKSALLNNGVATSPVWGPCPSNEQTVQSKTMTTRTASDANSGSTSKPSTAPTSVAAVGEMILLQARKKSQDLQSQQKQLLQQLQNLDQQVREASQRQVSIQQLTPIPSSGTRNPGTPAAACSANKSASRCGGAPSSSQPTALVRPAVGQQAGASRAANHPPVGSPTVQPPAPPPPPNPPPKAPPAPIKPK